jgi:hypothetical protein
MPASAAPLGRLASIEAVSSFLDHSSLAVTTVYLRHLEGDNDEARPAWMVDAEEVTPLLTAS